ncbi:MAG: hypothetical protein QOJ29_1084 [Thermoleophilaceae bacterium]|nr:hypothetical protein [Thermoleophilaceae bacterium]
MRRIALLIAVGLLATAATAWAVTNTVSYTVTLKKAAGKPSPKTPVNVGYNAVLHIDTDPAGNQPDTAPITSIYFPKQIKQNAKLVPSCTQEDIDGQQTAPAKCSKAKVGTGFASALAGSAGSPAANSVKEDLDVTFYNGKGGKQVLLVLNSQPSAPVAITNRVVPGDLASGGGAFGYRVDFKIPEDLQNQLGLAIALTDFKVAITNKPFKLKNGKKVGYLQLTGCPGGKLPIKAIAHFATGDVTNESTAKC